MSGTEERHKPTIEMDRRVWTPAKLSSLSAGQPVGDWLEHLIKSTDDGTLERMQNTSPS